MIFTLAFSFVHMAVHKLVQYTNGISKIVAFFIQVSPVIKELFDTSFQMEFFMFFL